MRQRQGRLGDVATPTIGEHTTELARIAAARVEHIVSGAVDTPVDYLADEDEWVLLVAGAATLAVAGDVVALGPGDWIVLPAGTPHRLLDVAPATSWITVTGRRVSSS